MLSVLEMWKRKHSEPASKISLFLPQERNSQSWIQKPPCAFLSLSCYPQINKVNKMFVLLAHQSQKVWENISFPAQAVTCCACQQLLELPLQGEEDTSPSALHLLASTSNKQTKPNTHFAAVHLHEYIYIYMYIYIWPGGMSSSLQEYR